MAKRNEQTETAAQAYTRRAAEIDSQIKTLLEALAAHRRGHEARPWDWGFTGDLGHVQELLVNINDFLANNVDDDLHCDHADGCCREHVGMICDGR